jgi:AAHS family 4-hydroxybenzoate transporter-like MFS transporter
VWNLFTDGRMWGTILLWASYFNVFLLLVTNATWTPTLLRTVGIDVAHSAVAVAVFALGSVVGTPLAGFFVSRFAAHAVLPVVLLGSALTLGGVGYAVSSFALVVVLQGLAGFCLGSGSSGLIALTASFYPITVRSTGLGWAMGLGRFGSLVGPLAVGALVATGLQIGTTFALLAAPALLAALFTTLIRLDRRGADVKSADVKSVIAPLATIDPAAG